MFSRLWGYLPSRRTPRLVVQWIKTHGNPPPDLDFVTDNLAVGGAFGNIRQVRALPALGITAVVSLSVETPISRTEMNHLRIDFLSLPTPDYHAPAIADLEAGSSWVMDQLARGGKVLIHCQRGMGRSVILAAAVLLMMGYDWQKALNLIKSKRYGVSPLRRQVAVLRQFAEDLAKTEASS
jgi:protein-tyrosine phosphatase